MVSRRRSFWRTNEGVTKEKVLVGFERKKRVRKLAGREATVTGAYRHQPEPDVFRTIECRMTHLGKHVRVRQPGQITSALHCNGFVASYSEFVNRRAARGAVSAR